MDETGKAESQAQTVDLETTTVDFQQPGTLVGQRLDGRFFIEKNLTDEGGDIGGMGVVYLAKDTKLMGKDVVVKILQEKAIQHGDIVRKFLHEKEALIRLDHPGIVRILDSGTLTDGNPFMVMEYIEGHSLRKPMRAAKQLPLYVVANVIESVTDALSAAHAKDILHRDVKPENIMLTPQEDGPDRVRLIDFGIARVGNSVLAPETEISRAIGTILYIAPEQLIGRRDIKGSADVYATAIVAYEMVTGELPFKPKAIAEMYQLEKEGVKVLPRELRPELPAAAEALILAALSFEPEKRPQSARVFGRDLARALRGQIAESSDAATEIIPEEETVVRRNGKGRLGIWATFGALALAAVAIPTGYFALNGLPNSKAGNSINRDRSLNADPALDKSGTLTLPAAGVEHELAYYLTVQKMRNGKPFETPFQSSGQEVFESGYKFRLNFVPDADGYMYVFNEGKNEQDSAGFWQLFPTPDPKTGALVASVSAGQKIGTPQNTFEVGGKNTTEVMWMIWTKEKRDDLEAVVRSAKPPTGAVNVDALRSFLEKFKDVKTEPVKDSANQRTIVKAKGDVVVHRFELEHR
ncbi:MAG: serine/threonine-protein kinase [Acidobacteriota bacterium]